MEVFAPLRIQEKWDNSGLIIGSADDEVTPPFETKDSLEKRLGTLYRDVSVHTVNAVGIFRCEK